MLRISSAFACGICMLIPSTGHAQKKSPAPAAVPGTPEEYAQLNQQKEVRGKLVTRDPDLHADPKLNKNLIFRYEYEVVEANSNYKPTKVPQPHDFTKEILNLQMKVNAAMQIPNPLKQMAALEQLALQQQNLMMRIQQEQIAYAQREAVARENDIRTNNVPYIKVQRAKDFELEIQSDVIIRRLKPIVEYDDRGFLKEYTKAELDKLHLVDNPDKKRPGYPAKYQELKPKQTILIRLTPGKKLARPVNADKTTDLTEPFIPLRPTVRMIVIVEDIPDPNGALEPNLPPIKKKKKKSG